MLPGLGKNTKYVLQHCSKLARTQLQNSTKWGKQFQKTSKPTSKTTTKPQQKKSKNKQKTRVGPRPNSCFLLVFRHLFAVVLSLFCLLVCSFFDIVFPISCYFGAVFVLVWSNVVAHIWCFFPKPGNIYAQPGAKPCKQMPPIMPKYIRTECNVM